MKSNFFLFIVFAGVLWLVGMFIFGDSGILDNLYKAKEIEKLNQVLLESNQTIDEMIEEYDYLSQMKKPNMAFLIDQGRKEKNVVIFKLSSNQYSTQQSSEWENKELFLQGIIFALLILFAGCMGLFIISYLSKKNKENIKVSEHGDL